MTLPLFLCLDCGGTKTAAAISNANGTIIGRGFGGPSNYTSVGPVLFIEAVTNATLDALSSLSEDDSPGDNRVSRSLSCFEAVWLGVSGVDQQSTVDTLSPHISSLFSIPIGPRLTIANDTHLLASPLRMYPDAEAAVVVIAGTGSIVVAFRSKAGGKLEEMGRAGGYGWILGDEGSGFHVGKEALKWVLNAHDRTTVDGCVREGPSTGLEKKIYDHFGISTPPDIFGVVYAPDPLGSSTKPSPPSYIDLERKHRIASLAPLIFSSAFDQTNPDPEALSVLHTTSHALSDQIRVVLSGKGSRYIDPAKTVLCFGGSLLGVEAYRNLILDDLKNGTGGIGEFAAVEFVKSPHESGAQGLATLFKERSV